MNNNDKKNQIKNIKAKFKNLHELTRQGAIRPARFQKYCENIVALLFSIPGVPESAKRQIDTGTLVAEGEIALIGIADLVDHEGWRNHTHETICATLRQVGRSLHNGKKRSLSGAMLLLGALGKNASAQQALAIKFSASRREPPRADNETPLAVMPLAA